MNRDDVYWLHPAPRKYEDPLRQKVRERFGDYRKVIVAGTEGGPQPDSSGPPLLLVRPLLKRMATIEGWLEEDEADLLIAATTRALSDAADSAIVVEVGSYCGRATIVLAAVVRATRPLAKVLSIDPHDGRLGAADCIVTFAPSLQKLKHNLMLAGVAENVDVFHGNASDVPCKDPVAVLLIDGLHDHRSVARDFHHFEPYLAAGAYVIFHDYATYFPGVTLFVDELIDAGHYRKVGSVHSMIALQKVGPTQSSTAVGV